MSKSNYNNMYNKSKNGDRPVVKPSFNKDSEKVFEAPKPVKSAPEIQNDSEPVVEAKVEAKVDPVIKPVVEPKPVPQPQPAPQPKPTSFKAEVFNCVKLNVREEPSTDAPVIDILNAGYKVTVYPEQSKGEFCKVVSYTTGKEGYCMKKFLKKIVK